MKETVNLDELAKALPPIFGREALKDLMPGVVHPGYMKNLDARGEGPPRIRMGRKIVYQRDSFVRWLAQRSTPLA